MSKNKPYVREGILPTTVGCLVTAAGFSMFGVNRAVASGVVGFGLATMILGVIDLVEHRNDPPPEPVRGGFAGRRFIKIN
ncbi:hypothetical protein E0485_06370 [Paenibacillus albiflavus]|uniref:Uncharacterized protein n=1 Tax=Paenibacillus albiflavus TaxID=2545760 RepID=A0A4R4EMC1_9BACL|nr:hypothetical protein [Paenibacillus albiflavus]TCZ79478.1 hypothetical protein E0485_06370 [Paenibacillus albiflavus]